MAGGGRSPHGPEHCNHAVGRWIRLGWRWRCGPPRDRSGGIVSGRVVVVGGGIAGASTAFALARRGVGVTVVDDGRVGSATAASAGIVAPWVSAAGGVFYDLYAAGAAFYPLVLR